MIATSCIKMIATTNIKMITTIKRNNIITTTCLLRIKTKATA
jgi:hypothetical protein